MRITSHHLIDLAAAATSKAQTQVAEATEVASSGLEVAVPSDDVTAWVSAARERVRQAISAGGGDAISAGRDQLQQTDSALSTISDVVARAKELAIQGSNASLSATDRNAMAAETAGLYKAALAAANAQGTSGTYLLAGTQSTAKPFDDAGAYHGDAKDSSVATHDGTRHGISLTGDVLTASHGVDVMPTIAKLADALSSNDPVAIQSALGSLSTAVTQLAAARAAGGGAGAALDEADDARRKLEQQLSATAAQLVQADAVGAASRLAQATQALDISRAVSSRVIASLTNS